MWLFYTPSLLLTLIVAYILGFTVMLIGAGYIAPRVAKRVAGRFSLQASMVILGLIVILAGIAGIGIITYILLDIVGVEITAGFIISILVLVLVLNMITYILSPLLINMMYGAKRDPQLQRVVDDVARTLGFSKPPRAVIVEGPPNAFAYGNFMAGKYIAVSRSLMAITTPEELRAVIGHELGHHKHRDNAIMLFMGLIPSILYFLGVTLVRIGIISGYTRTLYSRKREGGGGGLVLVLAGIVAIIISFIVQILVLAFSRLREYYADSAGAYATSPRAMQRALARLHVYYRGAPRAREEISGSKLKALFIYAFTEAYASPFYSYTPLVDPRSVDIDKVVEELKRAKTEDISEFFSTHPPIPKRIRSLEALYTRQLRLR
ncbi:MAG: zinc metalloprotease HtpX [Desulfurococcaceae archaeon]|nr:zinc metalloprotease HtpX [Desulfurococcaceae archaeon]